MRLKMLIAITAGIAAQVALAAPKEPPPPEPASHPNWADIAARARDQIVSNLYDPGSADIRWSSGFRWGYVKPFLGRRSYGWIACGSVNAKNRLGGYAGPKPFWILADTNGGASFGLADETISSCDESTSVRVNPELVNSSQPITPSGSLAGIADEISKLASLRDQGIITQAEFDAQKAKLLAR